MTGRLRGGQPSPGRRRGPAERAGPSRRAVLFGGADLAAAAALGARIGTAGADPDVDPDAGLGTLTLFGAAGTFGGIGSAGVGTVAVPGWGFGPGQSAFMSAAARDGSVFVGTTPFTDDQSKPTANNMELAVYEPRARRFTRLTIPSSTGRTALPRPGANYHGVGGGDVADVVVAPGPGGADTAVFVSAMPYFGWNIPSMGQLPTVGQVRRSGTDNAWRYDARDSRTADGLAATMSSTAAAQMFPNLGPGQARSSRGAAAIARLPRSGHVVVAQYFGSDLHSGLGQGALLVVDLTGRVRATFQYPVVHVFGQPVAVSPREVVADPSSAADDERFVLISDCWTGNGQTVPFGIQEFSYRASTGTVAARSTAARAVQDGSRMETATIAPDGTLYVARTTADGMNAAEIAVYPKVGGERGLVSRTPAGADWAEKAWGQTNTPDAYVTGSDRGGLVRSIVADPSTGVVYVAGVSGLLQAVAPVTSGGQRRYQVVRSVDLRLNSLRSVSHHHVGLRRGAVDPSRGVLWLPVNQVVLSDMAWPYAPFPLSQWLYRVDLRKLLA